jgi:hypothetical protein
MEGLLQLVLDSTAYVWDITSPDPHPIEVYWTFSEINALAFSSPSSLISISMTNQSSSGRLVPHDNSVETDSKSTAHHLAQVKSVTLQAMMASLLQVIQMEW